MELLSLITDLIGATVRRHFSCYKHVSRSIYKIKQEVKTPRQETRRNLLVSQSGHLMMMSLKLL